ncbi:putative membrane protein [Bradyrhizobium sp. GM0.4]|uniref:hypothetical protein n=1 Tax=Bradyrhizobium sp. 197 TaxID=2782663 RepID=UPI001FF7C915|nr:hypothetical protein [Bradyrhizobium sp. 197]MCK1480593.1 hypothetical protein [Bradyrhizobium sp. 197]
MKRLMTALVTTLLATSLLAVTAEARGGGGHMSGFGGGHMGGFGGGHIGFGNHGGAYRSGLHHDAMHHFGGVWPRYGTLLGDSLDCYDLYYGRRPYSWPPYCG